MGVRERIADSITQIRTRSQRLVQLNLELLSSELKQKGQQYGAAVGMLVAAGVLALYALGFALATAAVALYIVLPLWLSLLIVTAALLLIVLVLALVGRARLRAAKTASPERTIAEARATRAALQAGVTRTTEAVRDAARPLATGPSNGGAPSPQTPETPPSRPPERPPPAPGTPRPGPPGEPGSGWRSPPRSRRRSRPDPPTRSCGTSTPNVRLLPPPSTRSPTSWPAPWTGSSPPGRSPPPPGRLTRARAGQARCAAGPRRARRRRRFRAPRARLPSLTWPSTAPSEPAAM